MLVGRKRRKTAPEGVVFRSNNKGHAERCAETEDGPEEARSELLDLVRKKYVMYSSTDSDAID